MKTLLAMMRVFHYVVGITAPDKSHEKQIFYVWIAVVVGLITTAVLFAWFLVSHFF